MLLFDLTARTLKEFDYKFGKFGARQDAKAVLEEMFNVKLI